MRPARAVVALAIAIAIAAGCTTFGETSPTPVAPGADTGTDGDAEAEPVDPGDDPDAAVVESGAIIPDGGRIVFVSSSVNGGSFGGASEASGRCTVAAAAAGLAGVFVAWIQDGDPRARVGDAGAYYKRDGTLLFDAAPALENVPPPRAPIDLNEKGQRIDAGVRVWTGKPGANCLNWTRQSDEVANYGNPSQPDKWANTGNTQSCGALARFYCFQQ